MHHFMWIYDVDADGAEHPRDTGCSSCSSAADQIPSRLRQLHVRNTTLAAVLPHRGRAGGSGTPWSPAQRGDYPGISAFLQVGDEVFHTYSTFGRGIEGFHNGNPYLDLTALGRQEAWEEPKGRATPLGLHVGGPNLRLPDEYDA